MCSAEKYHAAHEICKPRLGGVAGAAGRVLDIVRLHPQDMLLELHSAELQRCRRHRGAS
jgi:hypothetical protein